jgi:ABC-type Fe3+/spermidine/putrescine transport system ATPase subunit
MKPREYRLWLSGGIDMTPHLLEVERLTKVFHTPQGMITAVDNVTFALSQGEFFTMLGPSGCGKTTTLRMIAGLERVTSGRIMFDGKDFTRFSPAQRNIGMVFQSYALFPHMKVFENVAYGLRIRNLTDGEIKQRVRSVLELTGLEQLGDRYPPDLSGGQQQRVSIARALVYEPSMLLLDEPLANIDAKMRVDMREEIRRIQKDLGITTVYVTHDQEEAMSISDRMGIFQDGRLMQLGTPREIYNDPQSMFVADFIGKANAFPVRLKALSQSRSRVVFTRNADLTMNLNRGNSLLNEERRRLEEEIDGLVMVRPEHLKIRADSEVGLPFRIVRIQFLGSITRYIAVDEHDDSEITVDTPGYIPDVNEGDAVRIIFKPEDAFLFDSRRTS